MDKNKLAGLLFSIAAVLFYISAIIAFVEHNTAMGATWLSIGTVMLVLGANQVGKKK